MSSRNQSVEQNQAEEEEEYCPGNVAFNQSLSDPDLTFFSGFQNETILQELLQADDFQIPSLTIDNTAAWNQGGGNPNFQGG
jgi:hypothetical protein